MTREFYWGKKMQELEPLVVREYTAQPRALYVLAKQLGTSPATVAEILRKNSVAYRGAGKYEHTPEHRRRNSERMRAMYRDGKLKAPWKGKSLLTTAVIKMAFQRMGFTVTEAEIAFIDDAPKYKLISKALRRDAQACEDINYFLGALRQFYSDPLFNAIYVRWIQSGRQRWYRPSLDHKVPLSRGGSRTLENLQFITWFENHAKKDYSWEEWQAFKAQTNTTSDLFVEHYEQLLAP